MPIANAGRGGGVWSTGGLNVAVVKGGYSAYDRNPNTNRLVFMVYK